MQRTEGGGDFTQQGFAQEFGFSGGDDLVNGADGLLGALSGGGAGIGQDVAAHELHAAEGAFLDLVVAGEAFFKEE